jgi:hypothetical protein
MTSLVIDPMVFEILCSWLNGKELGERCDS